MLRVRLLGELALERDGEPVAPPAAKRARMLLGWLALHPGPQPRAALAARLWPDVLDESARTSLRNAAWALRRALGDEAEGLLVATRETVELADEPYVWVDVRAFGALVAAGRLEDALALDRGELLPGLADEWIDEAREEHRRRVGAVLERLADEAPDPAAATEWARRRAALDPLSEEAARALMRALAGAGDRAEALAAYERLAERLRAELQIVPSDETRALAAALRDQAPPARAVSLPLPPRIALAAEGPFVGRSSQLEALRSAWRLASGGPARLTGVAGEPGIGKTRLAAELAREVREGGGLVLYGGTDEEALVPYQPFVEAVRHYLRENPDPMRTDLGLLVPEAGSGHAAHSDAERLRMFDAVSALLASLADEAPLLVVLDDLHWADRGSVQLLKHAYRAAEHARMLVLMLYRRAELTERVSGALADLRRDHPWQELGLAGLAEADVAALAEAAGRADMAGPLHERTSGNPFFVQETLRHLEEDGGIEVPPDRVREVIRRRAGRLGEEAARLLSIAAVLGSRFEASVLERVAGAAVDEAADALDAASAAGLIAESRERPGTYGFAHALVRETLYADLGSRRRALLHTRAGETLEASGTADPAELAHHFLTGASAGDREHAIECGLAAAAVAEARVAYEEAVELYGRVLELVPADDQRRRRIRARRAVAAQSLYHLLLRDAERQASSPAGSSSPTIS